MSQYYHYSIDFFFTRIDVNSIANVLSLPFDFILIYSAFHGNVNNNDIEFIKFEKPVKYQQSYSIVRFVCSCPSHAYAYKLGAVRMG